MKDIYNNIRICPFNGFNNLCDMRLEPDIGRIMAHSRNYDELQYIWSEWRKKSGPPLKNKFMRYVQLANQAAIQTGKSPKLGFRVNQPKEFFIQVLWMLVIK